MRELAHAPRSRQNFAIIGADYSHFAEHINGLARVLGRPIIASPSHIIFHTANLSLHNYFVTQVFDIPHITTGWLFLPDASALPEFLAITAYIQNL